MSENLSDTPEPQDQAVASQPSAGALLRQAREASGLHVAALAVAMKVPVKKLEALEADRMDLLPDAVFVRALAASMCRALKIDAAPILERLPSSGVPRLDAETRGINAPFKAASPTSFSVPGFLTRPVVLIVLGLLLAAGVVLLVPVSLPSVSAPVAASQTPATLSTAMPEVVPSAVPAASAAAPASPAAVAPAAAQEAVAAPAPQPPASAPAPATATAAQTAILSFRAKGTSWIEVTDAQGTVQLRKTLFAGDEAAAGGVAPLTVVVGRADLTQVEVRGKPFDLLALAKDNVARFEVK